MQILEVIIGNKRINILGQAAVLRINKYIQQVETALVRVALQGAETTYYA